VSWLQRVHCTHSTHTRTRTHTYTHTHSLYFTHTHTHTRTHTHTHTHTEKYTHTHTHTYTHTHTQRVAAKNAAHTSSCDERLPTLSSLFVKAPHHSFFSLCCEKALVLRRNCSPSHIKHNNHVYIFFSLLMSPWKLQGNWRYVLFWACGTVLV